jgi:N-methylhydantoinase B
MERMTSPPFGLRGGCAGAAAVVTLTTPDGVTRLLPSKGAFAAPAGSVIDMITPGSGGFGPVAERDPAAIGRDLIDGYVSAAAATRDYGVTDPEDLRRIAALEDKR